MKRLKNIRKAINEIAIKLAEDQNLQKLLIVDAYDVDGASFTPFSAAEMLAKNYICMTAQTEDGIKKLNRNSFLNLSIQNVNFNENDISTTLYIYIVMDINHTLIKNNQDRGLAIADCLIDDLENMKLTAMGKISVEYLNRVSYAETFSGYLLKISFTDQQSEKVEI